ncbi:MAG: hypothetical protein H6R13_2219 [Proteobacteria bacterium]|nr:hypothetical protein [Pseudomonadota bacterium]
MRRNAMALLAALICGSAGCAETVPSEWPKECVGRLQLALPGEADQGAILGRERFRDSVQYGRPDTRFPDGETADWTALSLGRVTHPLMKEEKLEALVALKKIKENVTKTYKTEEKINVQTWPVGKQEGMGWIAPNRRITLNIFAHDALFSWSQTSNDAAEFAEVERNAKNIVSGLRPRQLFDVPSEPGLCLPYVFIPDNGQEKHAIAMTYRLKEHPDITVNLKSKTAEPTPKPGGDIRPDSVTNDFRTDTFWGTVTAPGNLRSARSIWHAPAKRQTQLAGRSAMETFLAVVRLDEKNEDFIYHTVSRGNPDTPEAAPDVRLVVEQKRENAIKRGITPLTQDEVLKLARQIAASVSQRTNR